jgi:hypothetical protein
VTNGGPRFARSNLSESQVDDLRAEIGRLNRLINTPMTAWQPIATVPTDRRMFLVFGDGKMSIWRGDILADARNPRTPIHLSMRYVTHWMRLPEPPATDAGGV